MWCCVVRWGVCLWRDCLCGPWVPGCWREQIRSGWSDYDTSTNAWMIQSPVRRRRHPFSCVKHVKQLWKIYIKPSSYFQHFSTSFTMWSWMHHEHILPCDFIWTGWFHYLECLPLLHWELTAVPCYEVIGAAVAPLREGWGCAAISVRKRRQTLLFLQSWINCSRIDLPVRDDLRFIADVNALRSDRLRRLVLLWVKMRWAFMTIQHTDTSVNRGKGSSYVCG